MNCPQCENTTLRVAERQGIEIDFCPRCRGVWLDRGELDKIIDRSNYGVIDTAEVEIDFDREPGKAKRGAVPQRDDDDYHPSSAPKNLKKKGLLGELFDLFD